MQKLQGLAKTWYESLHTILFTWQEWQEKLLSAFPCEQNYGQTLEDMIKRKSRYNESIEVYYYEKLSLVNQCDIVGTRAAECIIHGITDKTLKSGALALRCTHPDQLLQYLLSNRDYNQSGARPNHPIGCYNCKEKGHHFLHCTKPLTKCTRCNRIGHIAEKCYNKSDDKLLTNASGSVQKTMRIDFINNEDANIGNCPGSKFIKEVTVNSCVLRAFIDFGSDVTLIRESTASQLGVSHDNVPTLLKGFGNTVVQSLGNLSLDMIVDEVEARVACKVVPDYLLEVPVLMGQSFTEQSHIAVYKDRKNGNELPCSELVVDSDNLLRFSAVNTIYIYGPTTIRVETQLAFDGDVLLKNIIAGKPNNIRMPFGLANAPAVFQRMINTVLGSVRFSKATVYIDDILIYGKDATQCLERLEEVLKMLEKVNLTLNLSKCEFLRDKVDYLGYEISASGIRPGEKKICSVVNFPRPESVHNIRQFLGLASYFCKFIQNFAQISYPLSKLLKKDAAWEWNDDQE